MALLVRGLSGLIGGDDDGDTHDHDQSREVQSNPKIVKKTSSSPALLSGHNQKLLGVTNNTNLNLNGDVKELLSPRIRLPLKPPLVTPVMFTSPLMFCIPLFPNKPIGSDLGTEPPPPGNNNGNPPLPAPP
ncbi:uncharacterized protein G2W53_006215 [Senna tora]|uniref:Uncharacterized protein n=1 Tax=Senna tora TaxID=362788 RepID=A0A834X536_9FABA|nr:uncharacterized protein G2W53_006215 [Senna tora]